MCGIVGILTQADVVTPLVEGLKRLEYRGYDSAGIATVAGRKLHRARAEGKIIHLEHAIAAHPITGNVGIGHTRWATHGAPTTDNAHPHATQNVAVVHNGIIENFLELRHSLENLGAKFTSETDTEVVPQLISAIMAKGRSFEQAVMDCIKRLEGAFAFGIICADQPDMLVGARRGSPLIIGVGQGETAGFYIGSDAMALAPYCQQIAYLEEGDIVFLHRRDGIRVLDASGKPQERPLVPCNISVLSIGKENYRHFMLKEIYEQPSVVGDALRNYINTLHHTVMLPEATSPQAMPSHIQIVACGTSYYAGMVARYWFERIAGIACTVEVASEFRYRQPVLPKGGLTICISQSGETADTLAALRYSRQHGQKVVAVVNVPQSTIAREADLVLPTYSGPEIGVASTKAFTTQLVTLASLVAYFVTDDTKRIAIIDALNEMPHLISQALQLDARIQLVAHEVMVASSAIYIGRGVSYPLAMEGALKLKEISYIHAEAAAAGELKHGPIALIDEHMPVICLAPKDELFEKTASNIREIHARSGKIILLSDRTMAEQLHDVTDHLITMPTLPEGEIASQIIAPVVYAIPMQLLAYHVAVMKGTDVDQPRNLAKSVTVE